MTAKEKFRRIVEHMVLDVLKSKGLVKEEKGKPKEKPLDQAPVEGQPVQKPKEPKDETKKDTLVGLDVNTKSEGLKKIPGQRGAIKAGDGRGGEAEITLDEIKKLVHEIRPLKEFTKKATRQAGHIAQFYKDNPEKLGPGSSPSDVGFGTVTSKTGQTRSDAMNPLEDEDEVEEAAKCDKWWKEGWAKKEK